ncbi:MAG TPA: potassium channel family protein [Candidatus Bilophila faecipullorum]|uniref:Potassium channel family protein n=2 Tax=Bilophila TaxID=35832 RepID=A0A9D1QZX8_9BACT|nr:potassium channel family protein [uncultured Bilophila sp.]HIW78370.1 potassium channel family protein [Candidatus Bilophila faecipullorum]
MPRPHSPVFPRLYAHRFETLFASLLCVFVINIFFPEDIYDGVPQSAYLPFQFLAGINLFGARRKYMLTLIATVAVLLLAGRLLDRLTPLNLREALAFGYVVFFGWVMLEVFRQIHGAKMVDTEIVLAALCGLILIGYCGFFVFVGVEMFVPHSFSGITEGQGGLLDLFYFSYVTILTIGYGDIAPRSWVAKNATVLIALTAYMYSIVIMATIVSQFASNRKGRKIAGMIASAPGKEERPPRKNT